MLLEFRVKNFLSFRDEQVLSLLATRDRSLQETHTLETGLGSDQRALRSIALYGPNASGKTNLLWAMSVFRQIVRYSATAQEGDPLPVTPFAFEPGNKGQPSVFEVTFRLGGIRHQYGFSSTSQRITEEWLLVYRKAKPQVWFSRQFDPETGKDSYLFSSHFHGQRKVWESSTRSNALFLSTATQLNSHQLRPIFRWISDWNFGDADSGHVLLSLLETLAKQVDAKTVDKGAILSFAQKADLGIRDFEIVREERNISHGSRALGNSDADLPVQLRFEHEASRPDGSVVRASLNLNAESRGTARMVAMADPALRLIQQGGLMIMDELDQSLHPLLVRALLAEIHRPVTTTGQLIFTTHNSSLLDPDLLRRDQIYLVDKGVDLASHLESLSNFHPRKQEALEKGYLLGRYGAVPVLTPGWF